MLFLIDAGNTRLKWATWQDGAVSGSGAVLWQDQVALEGLPAQWRALGRPQRAIVINVGGRERELLIRKWLTDCWHVPVVVLNTSAAAGGVSNGYLHPAKLGIDRWAALVAVRQRYDESAIIVDCGSAVTLDALTADGRHLGGVIFPGIGLMVKSLLENTHAIKSVDLDRLGANELFARDTVAGVQAGVRFAVVGAVDRISAEYERRVATGATRWVITGGDAQMVKPFLARQFEWLPHLVFEGMVTLAGELQ